MRKMSDIVRNQHPVTLPPSATVREACQRMRDRRVGAVLVVIAVWWAFSLAVMPFTAYLQKGKARFARRWLTL
jgi:hypothetical protein